MNTTQTKPEHLFIGCDGDLHDTRQPNWASHPLRENYSYTHNNIDTVAKLKATLRNGPYAWPGGYPMFFLTSDGGALSFDSVREELSNIIYAIKSHASDGWRVVGCDVNWEDSNLVDDHSGELIEAVYSDD